MINDFYFLILKLQFWMYKHSNQQHQNKMYKLYVKILTNIDIYNGTLHMVHVYIISLHVRLLLHLSKLLIYLLDEPTSEHSTYLFTSSVFKNYESCSRSQLP